MIKLDKYVCEYDGKEFKSESGFKYHLTKYYNETLVDYFYKHGLMTDDDVVICKICNKLCSAISAHIRNHKEISFSQYKEIYGEADLFSVSYLNGLSVRGSGENNPNHKSKTTEQQRKERSPFSKEFVNHKNENEHKEFISKVDKKRVSTSQIEYYLIRGHSAEEAKKLQSERQKTFSLKLCIEKYGEEEGLKIFKDRQERWQNTLNSKSIEEKLEINRKRAAPLLAKYGDDDRVSSAMSQNFFDKVYDRLPIQYQDSCMYERLNSEMIVENYHTGNNYYLDFYIEIDGIKKVIEFNGDYWHYNPSKYTVETPSIIAKRKADDIRNSYISLTHELLVIWESEYKANEEEAIQKAVDFLLEKPNKW